MCGASHVSLMRANVKAISVNVCLIIVSDCWGGAEAVVYELARHLRERRHAVTVLVNHEIIKFYQELKDVQVFDLGHLYPFKSISVRRLGVSWKYDLPRRLLSLAYFYLDELHLHICRKRVQRQITDAMIKNHVQVLHSHLPGDTFLVTGISVPSVPKVATIHGLPKGTWSARWKEECYRKALIKMNQLTTVSVFALRALCAWEPCFRQHIIVIPNGVDVSEIRKQTKLVSTRRASFNLLFPGGARPVKGGILLVEALAVLKSEVPNIHVYLAGEIPRNHPIRKKVEEFRLESNTTFTGFLPRQQYLNLLKSVDLLIMPSQQEGHGLAYLEAIALGKPVVAGNTSSIPETIKDRRNGILVRLDVDDLAHAVLKLCRDRDLAETISENNLRDATKFDWSPVVDRYVSLYRQLTTAGTEDKSS